MVTAEIVRHCKMFVTSEEARPLLTLIQFLLRRPRVDLTLRLNVLAVFAAIAFVGAVLLGAF